MDCINQVITDRYALYNGDSAEILQSLSLIHIYGVEIRETR